MKTVAVTRLKFCTISYPCLNCKVQIAHLFCLALLEALELFTAFPGTAHREEATGNNPPTH